MKKQLTVALAVTIFISSVFLVLVLDMPSTLAQYSWTDTIEIYKYVYTIYTNIRRITNNETVPVDVLVYITFTEKINLLEYYKLSANGTDFIVISQGNVTLSNATYYGLEPTQTLCFTLEAEGASSLSVDDTVKVGVKVEFWSAEHVHDLAVTAITLYKNVVGQGFPMYINATVENQGNFTETFNVTAYANTTIIQTKNVTLTSGGFTIVTFTWNTTDVPLGNYIINATAATVPGETETTDNTLADGTVFVTIPGDIDCDGDVDASDLLELSEAYGSKPGDANWNPNCDFNCDGKVDTSDLFELSKNYGKPT